MCFGSRAAGADSALHREAKAHQVLEAMVPPELVYRFHVALIRHGRACCKAQRPLCTQCPLTDLCEYYRTAT
jgi:endonuclease-3